MHRLDFSILQLVPNSLYFNQLWVSVLSAIYHKKKCLWWGQKDALICGYNRKSLGFGFIYMCLVE